MKDKSINLILEQIDKDDLVIYMGNEIKEDIIDKSIVMFTHDFSRTGAPNMVLETAKILKQKGYDIFVVSAYEGELANDFIEAGMNVVMYEKFCEDIPWMCKVAQVFDVVLLNTVLMIDVVKVMAPFAKKIYWWIHEGASYAGLIEKSIEDVPKIPSLKVIAASPMIQRVLSPYIETELFEIFVEDEKCLVDINESKDFVNFIIVGNAYPRKGHRVLIDAMKGLGRQHMQKMNMFFCGISNEYDKKELDYILEFDKENEKLYILNEVPKEELYKIYDMMDVVVVPSYEETTSLVAIEGMMKEKLCLVSDGCGICDYIVDKQDAIIFQRGNSVQLCELLKLIIDNYDKFYQIRKNGRKLFEKKYSKQVFVERIDELF